MHEAAVPLAGLGGEEENKNRVKLHSHAGGSVWSTLHTNAQPTNVEARGLEMECTSKVI